MAKIVYLDAGQIAVETKRRQERTVSLLMRLYRPLHEPGSPMGFNDQRTPLRACSASGAAPAFGLRGLRTGGPEDRFSFRVAGGT